MGGSIPRYPTAGLDFQAALQFVVQEFGLRPKDLSEASGVHPQTIHRQANLKDIRVSTLQALVNTLDSAQYARFLALIRRRRDTVSRSCQSDQSNGNGASVTPDFQVLEAQALQYVSVLPEEVQQTLLLFLLEQGRLDPQAVPLVMQSLTLIIKEQAESVSSQEHPDRPKQGASA